MDPVKVVIENWPQKNYLLEYIPVLIAVLALGVSLYSAYLTRKSFIASHRPYVWGTNYGYIHSEKKIMVPEPYIVAYRAKNAPSKITKSEVTICLEAVQLFSHKTTDFVRFPDDKSEWYFSIGKEDFNKIMSRSDDEKAKLTRLITIEYSSLEGGKTYHYKLQQTFSPADNQWKDTNEAAD